MPRSLLSRVTVSAIGALLTLFCPMMVQAQSVKIVLPERSSGFPDYEDANGDRYPENANRFKIAVGYRTGNHTGSSVPITAEGTGALLFLGYFDQTDVFFKMARVLSSNTKQLDKSLEQKSKDDIPSFGIPVRTSKGILEP